MNALNLVRRLVLPLLTGAALTFAVERAHAFVHLWTISQIYSNEDGSVQFIELHSAPAGENFTNNREVWAYRDGERVNTFTFPQDLPGSTQNSYLLLATGPIAGVEPDFTIPENFIPIDFETDAAIDIREFSTQSPNVITYESIPTDGVRSLEGDGSIRDPATVTNYSGDTAELSPPAEPGLPAVVMTDFRDGDFEMAFTTESGRSYTVEYTDSLEDADWQVLQTIQGNGEPAEVTDQDPGVPMRFYRVIVE